MSRVEKSFSHKMSIRHAYNQRTGLYDFVRKVAVKLILIVIAIVAAFLVLNHFVDIGSIIENYINSHGIFEVLTLFLISESVLGWIPPDFFIIWSNQFDQMFKWLSILGTISYFGGIIAYKLGVLSAKFPKIRTWLEKRNDQFFKQIKKWGGIIIILAALFPLPFATTSTAAGMVKYPFKQFLIYGLSRYLRFYFYGVMIYFALDKIL